MLNLMIDDWSDLEKKAMVDICKHCHKVRT